MAKTAVLLIGGNDPQGCAGLAVDIQTVAMHGCHAIPLMTALTEQTQAGLHALGALSVTQFMKQYHACVADFSLAGIKIGLIPNQAIAEAIVTILRLHPDIPVIYDPVMAASSGGAAVDGDQYLSFCQKILPYVTVITPNLIELSHLTGQNVTDVLSWRHAAEQLIQKGVKACLVKGGHADETDWVVDHYLDQQHAFYCYQQRLDYSVRGTGCILASSLCCYLSLGEDVREAVVRARIYLSYGFRHAKPIGPYHVFTAHMQQYDFADIPKLCYEPSQIGQRYQFAPCVDRLGIYPVVENSRWVNRLLAAGIDTIQLRMKSKTVAEYRDEIVTALSYCRSNTRFFVNDHWSLAIELGAYGVHLGQEDLHTASLENIAAAGLRLGVSTHSYWELARALAVNPSYIAFGPIFETNSKVMPFQPQGVDKVSQWVDCLAGHYPLVAIGGIDVARAKQLKKTQVGSVAMISAITQAENYQQVCHQLLTLWEDG